MTGSPAALYELVTKGSACSTRAYDETLWACEYKVGKLEFAIAVETGGVRNISFRHSDMGDDFYAVMYDGCVAVVPAREHPRNYRLDYVAYVSPGDGRVYRGLRACKATLR